MFYDFDYDADAQASAEERCIHTANEMFDPTDMPPQPARSVYIESFRRGSNYAWFECCFDPQDSVAD